jgi:hypothetical protein
MKKLLLILLFIPFVISAQKFYPGKMEFNDGKILECLLTVPTNSNTKIKTKLSEDAPVVIYKSEQLRYVTLYPGNEKTYEFARLPMKVREKSMGKEPAWMVVSLKGYVTLYEATNSYDIDDDNQLIMIGIQVGHHQPDYFHLARRTNEKIATLLATDIGFESGKNRVFRKLASEYFSDCEELVERLKNKEFKYKDIPKVFFIYNEWIEKTGVKSEQN